MPEGDTIHRAAERLRPALVDGVLERFEARARPPHPRRGERVESVEAHGKHLVMTFSGGLALRTHLGMTGSWHLYRAGERWRRPAHLARAVVGVEGWEAVCFAAPTVEVAPGARTRTRTGHLGPDLCEPDADLDECVARMVAADPATEVGDVLLDQRICCGVGNVYKSEVCFACRVHPTAAIGTVDDDHRRQLVETAARQLRSNLGRARRSTVGAGPGVRLAVYGRARQPCLRCGTPIRAARTGIHRRVTYWCPRCQRLP